MLVRLIRSVSGPDGTGPGNGQYALQKALAERGPKWLKIGGPLGDGELPWFWSWQDVTAALGCEAVGRPFVIGPNVLFQSSLAPGRAPGEAEICDAAHCVLMFTESAWYRDLIDRCRGPQNRAPIVLWPYPIDPKPGGPLPAEYDVLVYAKGGASAEVAGRLVRHFRRARRIVYGRYRREELFRAARLSRCCVYLSHDDRGPLALSEILLAGCPAIGVRTGAPFIQPGRTGVLLDEFRWEACLDAVTRCHALDRDRVAALAAEQFDTGRIVGKIAGAFRRIVARNRHRIEERD